MLRRRVVITGLGAISPLGQGAWRQWDRLLEGASGLAATPADWPHALPARVMAPVPGPMHDSSGGWAPTDEMSERDLLKSALVTVHSIGPHNGCSDA